MKGILRNRGSLALCLCFCVFFPAIAPAQGILRKLPAAGTWVRYEGECTQVLRRANKTGEEMTLKWQKQIVVKSLTAEMTDFRGKPEPCRWLELKITTGTVVDGALQAGPGSELIYKVLVPESVIQDKPTILTGGRDVYVSYTPIIKGFRKAGDAEPTSLTEEAQSVEGVFQGYPLVSLVAYYRTLTDDGEENVDLPSGAVSAKKFKGEQIQESRAVRSTNQATIWHSEQSPFGTAKWSAKTVTEEKNAVLPRSAFQVSSELTEEMAVAEVGEGAESDLMTP